MVVIHAVAVKPAKIKSTVVFKCMFGLHGSDCIRSEVKRKERYDRKYNKWRDDTLEEGDYEIL